MEYRSWQTKYRGLVLICANTRKAFGQLSGYGLCVMNLEGIYHFPDNAFGWRFSPFQTGKSYHIEPVPVKGRQRLFQVSDNLIQPVQWERGGRVDEQEKREWWTKVYMPLIENNK